VLLATGDESDYLVQGDVTLFALVDLVKTPIDARHASLALVAGKLAIAVFVCRGEA
jgi:hypothetical protein